MKAMYLKEGQNSPLPVLGGLLADNTHDAHKADDALEKILADWPAVEGASLEIIT